jgi:hypothetical protein
VFNGATHAMSLGFSTSSPSATSGGGQSNSPVSTVQSISSPFAFCIMFSVFCFLFSVNIVRRPLNCTFACSVSVYLSWGGGWPPISRWLTSLVPSLPQSIQSPISNLRKFPRYRTFPVPDNLPTSQHGHYGS